MFFYRLKHPNCRQGVLKVEEMSVYDLNDLQAKYDTLSNEYQICRCKLDSKCEALLILSRELDQCRSERDQFKLMAEQLRERYQALKRQMTGRSPLGSSHDLLDVNLYKDMETESLVQLLCDTKEVKKSLKFEVDDLKQKLNDAQGDIKLLREQIARQRVGSTDEGMTTRHFPAYEREDLVKQLEASREQYLQLEHDLQQLLDEKEDQETELDAYKSKYENLNRELNYILKGDEKRIVDIDALVAENKFLNERLKQMEEEKSMAMATASKYKSILERRKNKGILKFGQSRSGGLVITQKQVGQMLHNPTGMPSTPQAMADLQGLCGALLDTINDKNLALSHQRKTNKLLGSRVSELEKKLKTLEVAGLWNVPDMTSLEKLRSECDEVKTLIPRQFSESSDASTNKVEDRNNIEDINDLESELSSATPSSVTSPIHQQSVRFSSYSLDMDDLDLLPTKESNIPVKTADDTEPTKDSSLPQVHAFSEEEESDQLLAGFVIEKTAQKRKPQKYNKKDTVAKYESQSLLDNLSCSENESSPEKQRYTDIHDYDNDTDEKLAILLNDATSRLQTRSRNKEEIQTVIGVNSNTNLVQKQIKSSLVFDIECDFNRNTNALTNKLDIDPDSKVEDNLIDMNSPEREQTLPIVDSVSEFDDQKSHLTVTQSQTMTSDSSETSQENMESQSCKTRDLSSVIPSIQIDHITDCNGEPEEDKASDCDISTDIPNEAIDTSTTNDQTKCENHSEEDSCENSKLDSAKPENGNPHLSDIDNLVVEFKETDDLLDILKDEEDSDDDVEDNDDSPADNGSPSKEPLLFTNEDSDQANIYNDNQSASNLC